MCPKLRFGRKWPHDSIFQKETNLRMEEGLLWDDEGEGNNDYVKNFKDKSPQDWWF